MPRGWYHLHRRREVEVRLDKIAGGISEVSLLRTIPGVGPRTAEAVVAFTDRVERFGCRKQLASYFGMTPTEDSSGRVERHGHISKRGPSVVRHEPNPRSFRVTYGR